MLGHQSLDRVVIFPRQPWLEGLAAVSATTRLLEITDALVEAGLRFLIKGGHAVRINTRFACLSAEAVAMLRDGL